MNGYRIATQTRLLYPQSIVNPMQIRRPVQLAGWEKWLLAAGLFLVCIGMRLSYIAAYGSDLPFLDQWDAEGLHLFFPWFEDELTFSHFLSPHNEHRIVFTRLLAYGLLKLNGQWDALVQMAVNAVLHCAVVGILLSWVRRMLPWRHFYVLGLVLLLYSVLPFAWENMLWGFQSQFYLVLLLGVSGLFLVLEKERSRQGWWWVGLFLLVLSQFTMAVSLLFGATLIVYALVSRFWFQDQGDFRWALLVAGVVLTALSISLYTPVPGHAELKQVGVMNCLTALIVHLGWPLEGIPGMGLLLWLPVWIKGWISRGRGMTNADRLFWGLTIWIIGFALVASYSRTADHDGISSRYLDILALSVFVQVWAWLDLLWETEISNRVRHSLVHGILIYGCLLFIGIAVTTWQDFNLHLPWRKMIAETQEKILAEYLETGNAALLYEAAPLQIPYTDAQRLQRMLDHPGMRDILPRSIRISPWQEAFREQQSQLPDILEEPDQAFVSSYGQERIQFSTPQRLLRLPYLHSRVAGNLYAEQIQIGVMGNGESQPLRLYRDFPNHHKLRRVGDRWFPFFWETVPEETVGFYVKTEGEGLADDPLNWVALTAPVEVGSLSRFLDILLHNTFFFILSGTIFLMGVCYPRLYRGMVRKLD